MWQFWLLATVKTTASLFRATRLRLIFVSSCEASPADLGLTQRIPQISWLLGGLSCSPLNRMPPPPTGKKSHGCLSSWPTSMLMHRFMAEGWMWTQPSAAIELQCRAAALPFVPTENYLLFLMHFLLQWGKTTEWWNGENEAGTIKWQYGESGS